MKKEMTEQELIAKFLIEYKDELEAAYKSYDEPENIFVYKKIETPAVKKTKKTVCRRCNGRGRITAYYHVDNGICFRCGGTGQ